MSGISFEERRGKWWAIVAKPRFHGIFSPVFTLICVIEIVVLSAPLELSVIPT